jgi:predicted Fe-Mo cluster-binding NifX family protein
VYALLLVYMKTAFTTWNGRIAPVFDVAGHAVLVTSENGVQTSETSLDLPEGPVMDKIACLVNAGADTLVCGAISRQAIAMLNASNITVYPFIAGKIPDVIRACLNDRITLNDFAMPGCGKRIQCRRRHRGASRSGRMKKKQ